MYDTIESKLMDQQPQLYLSIKQKSIEKLNLPIVVGASIIGFGKMLDFYMFWISERRGRIYFNARREFTRARANNSVKVEFIEENQPAIFDAIDEIYNSYLQSGTNGNFQKEAQRVEEKKAIRAARAGNREKCTDIMLLWNDVTVFAFEKSDQNCDGGDIDVKTVEQIKIQGHRLLELFEDILSIMENQCYPKMSREFAIYRDYMMISDKTTLADVAAIYGLSRERIRQLVNAVDTRLFRYFKRAMMLDNAQINECIKMLADVFEAVEYDAAHLISYGLAEIGDRKKQAIFNMLFGKHFSNTVINISKTQIETARAKNELIQKKKDILEAWIPFSSKICYPSDLVVDQSIPIVSYEKETTYVFEKKIRNKLEKFESIIEIIESPDIIYYYTNQTDHRPHYLLRLPDSKSVLVIVLPTINMAFHYNIRRCNELHRFCKENGYGYLIIDDRGNSIYDIKNRAIDSALVERLDTMLSEQTMIVWRNIKELKLTYPVSNADIAAYVLQNKLYFTMEPFCIKRREDF